ncbi:MAG: PepSY-associated TM helix domain-containing protein [Planctomycetota bacterium]
MKSFVNFCRVLHVIASMLGVVVMFLMALTGVMLVHPETFKVDASTTSERTATIPAEVVKIGDKNGVAQAVQKALPNAGVLETVDEFEEDGLKGYHVVLACPQRRFDGKVDAAGNVVGTMEEYRLAGTLGNLHKSNFPDAGRWRVLMDVGAGSLVLACLTGLVLWLGTKPRRILGLVAFVIGLVIFVGGYFWLVP